MAPLPKAEYEAFCLAYVASNDDVSSYQSAFPNCKSREGARVGAFRLLHRDDVDDRIIELRQRAADRVGSKLAAQLADKVLKLEEPAVTSAESLIAEAEWLMREAASSGQYGPAVAALRLKAQLCGVLSDKEKAGDKIINNVAMFIDAPPQESRDEWIARRRRIAGSLVAPNGAADRGNNGDMVQ